MDVKTDRAANEAGALCPEIGRPRDLPLEALIAQGALEVRFQPWIALRSGDVVGAEALVRSVLEPDASTLFHRARRAGLADALSKLSQSKALSQAAAWSGPLEGLGLSLNLLPSEIAGTGHDEWLLDEMERIGFEPARLTVEITEHALLVGQEAVARRLARLRSAGVKIALDDFGSGYASLAYLTNLPLDMLKLDRSLVLGLVAGRRDRIVMRAMLRLAQDLELKTLVEGVEETGQQALLAGWGCDLYQGFLGAAALDETALAAFVAQSNARAA
jgi:EAL domain-containing protein (putative c-di-GMP-specific phosphodiesterase class I)